jgi:hypothetical protein
MYTGFLVAVKKLIFVKKMFCFQCSKKKENPKLDFFSTLELLKVKILLL